MTITILRRFVRDLEWLLIERRAPEWVPRDLGGLSIVFSPHYDDETLGAGGTILRLRKAGFPVHIVFMTDGSRSHAGVMPGAELSLIRREEAMRAAAALGVDADHLTFLEYPEQELTAHKEHATNQVAELLVALDCHRVIVPSALEPNVWSLDHRTTTEIVHAALVCAERVSEVVEYFVWFWYHWPWVPVFGTGDPRQLAVLSWQNAFGIVALRAANASVDLAPLRLLKQAALDQYRTQMTRLSTDPPWPVLGDVARGEFLRNFFGSHEFLRITAREDRQHAP